MSAALRRVSGLGDHIARLRDTFPARIAAAAGSAFRALETSGKLRPGASPPSLEMPETFAETLAAALALEENEPGPPGFLDTLAAHYLDRMPRQHVEQLDTRDAPCHPIFHTPLDGARLPRLSAALARLRALLASAGVPTDGAAVTGWAEASGWPALDGAATLCSIYRRSYYGGYMPLLYGYPADLAVVQRALDGGAAFHEAFDRHLAAPLIHELTHLGRRREALFPPYLDECIAGYLGVLALPEFAWPREGESNALFAAPWLTQVGQALARTVGLAPLLSAHAGLVPFADALGPALHHEVARLGWQEHRSTRALHFLSSNVSPTPWIKLFFLAAPVAEPKIAGAKTIATRAFPSLPERSLAELAALPWDEIPLPDEAPLDRQILDDALRSMCLRNHQEQGAFRVSSRPPASAIEIDLLQCSVTTARGADGYDPAPPSHLFPPSVAARLRRAGIAGYGLELRRLDALADAATALHEGAASGARDGYQLTRRPLL